MSTTLLGCNGVPQFNDKGTAYEMTGPSNAPVVVLIHGLGLTRQTWAGMVPQLARRYRVVSYDLFGHGESALAPSTPSVQVFSQQLCDLMDGLNIASVAAIGFSLGGMINRRFAMDHGDRVSSLVVLNSPHDRGAELQARVEQQAADAMTDGPGATLDAAIDRWFTPEFRDQQPGVINEIRQWILANNPLAYGQTRAVLAHGVKELIRPNPPIAHPTLVMTCEHDSGSTPAMASGIAAEIAGSDLIIVPALRHMGLMERPDLFAAPILNFLDLRSA